MSKSQILYKDVAPGAEDNAAVTSAASAPFSNLDQLPCGLTPAPVLTCELNAWGLNGAYRSLDTQQVALWSAAMSGPDGLLPENTGFTVNFSRQYSSVGVTLVFDAASGDYCDRINIKWYQQNALKADTDFAPDGVTYFCQRKVESYDRLVVTLKRTSLPFRYAKLNRIIFGVHRDFGMTELRRVSIVNEMDLSALSLPVSTMSWTLDSRSDVDFLFQLKQPVEVSNDGALIGVYYIDGYKRTAERLYSIDCYDALGVLDESPFVGGVYSGKSAKALLGEIVGEDFALDFQAEDIALTGILKPSTRREAMQQVLFAWGVCASTDGRDGIRVFVPGKDAAEIGPDRTFTGASVEASAIVTQVRVTAHTYTQASDGDVEVGGVKYRDTKTVYTVDNPNVTATDKQNVVEVAEATLVSPAIGRAAARRVYDYCAGRIKNQGRFVWQGERLGDSVTRPNAWGETNTGRLSRMEINLSNTVVANGTSIGV